MLPLLLGYQADVEKWIKECEPCQCLYSPSQKPETPLGTITMDYLFQKLSCDIYNGPPTSGYIHKWVGAFALCYNTHCADHTPSE